MYYFPQPTSFTHGHPNLCPSSFFPHHTSHEIFLHPNNVLHEPFSGNFFPTDINGESSLFVTNNISDSILAPTSSHQLKEDLHFDPFVNLIASKKSRSRKDRHSMIFTAQGLRHRRVRLSIEIAHKFFNLQDMLGFDKASQTLDWLFKNSNKAIQQLVNIKNNSLPNSSSSTSKKKPVVNIHGTRNEKKKSREKARARARERTLQKQRIRELDAINNETQWKDMIVEAILTRKPLKPSPIYVYQQNISALEGLRFQSEIFSHY